MTAPRPETWTEDARPITLNEACSLFHGSLTPSTLWAENKRGRLAIFKIGRRYYTTKADVTNMVEACRVNQLDPGSTSTGREKHGPSETERVQSAQAAVKASVIKLRKSLRSI